MYFSVILHILALASASITIAIPLPSDKAFVQASPSSPLIPRTDGTGMPHRRPYQELNRHLANFKTLASAVYITSDPVTEDGWQKAIEKIKAVAQGIRNLKVREENRIAIGKEIDKLYSRMLDAAINRVNAVMEKVNEAHNLKHQESMAQIRAMLQDEFWGPIATHPHILPNSHGT